MDEINSLNQRIQQLKSERSSLFMEIETSRKLVRDKVVAISLKRPVAPNFNFKPIIRLTRSSVFCKEMSAISSLPYSHLQSYRFVSISKQFIFNELELKYHECCNNFLEQFSPESDIPVDQIIRDPVIFYRTPRAIITNTSLPITDIECPLIVRAIAKPLVTKFNFHFSGKKQTSQVGKFYYLEYVVKVLRNQRDLFENTVQSLFDINKIPFAALDEVIYLMVTVLEKRILREVPLFEPKIACNLIEKLLVFEDLLRTEFLFGVRQDEDHEELILLTDFKDSKHRYFLKEFESTYTKGYRSSNTARIETTKKPWRGISFQLLNNEGFVSLFSKGLVDELTFDFNLESEIEYIPQVAHRVVVAVSKFSETYANLEMIHIIHISNLILKELDFLCSQFEAEIKNFQNEYYPIGSDKRKDQLECCSLMNGLKFIYSAMERWTFEEFFILAGGESYYGVFEFLISKYTQVMSYGIHVLVDNVWFEIYKLLITHTTSGWPGLMKSLDKLVVECITQLKISKLLNSSSAQTFMDIIASKIESHIYDEYIKSKQFASELSKIVQVLKLINEDSRLAVTFPILENKLDNSQFEFKREGFLSSIE